MIKLLLKLRGSVDLVLEEVMVVTEDMEATAEGNFFNSFDL